MAKYWIGLIITILGGLYCLYAAMFFAWSTAILLKPENVSRAKLYANLWGGGFLFFLVLFVVCIGRIAYLYDKKKKQARTTE